MNRVYLTIWASLMGTTSVWAASPPPLTSSDFAPTATQTSSQPSLRISQLPVVVRAQELRKNINAMPPDEPELSDSDEQADEKRLNRLGALKTVMTANAQTPERDLLVVEQAQQDPQKIQALSQTVHALLSHKRLTYAALEESLEVYQNVALNYLDALDPNHLFFTHQDVQYLVYSNKGSLALTKAIIGQNPDWIFSVFEQYKKRQRQQFKWARKELIHRKNIRSASSFEAQMWQPTVKNWLPEAARKVRWRQAIHEDLITLSVAGKSWDDAINELSETYATTPKTVARMNELEVAEVFLRSYSEYVDPHSLYLAPRNKQIFRTQLTNVLEGIGVVWGKENNNIVVKQILPNSPATENKNLKVGDILLRLGSSPTNLKSVHGERLEDVVDQMRGPNNTTLILETQSPASKVVSLVALQRRSIALDNKKVTSKTVRLPLEQSPSVSSYKALVVKVPSFYQDSTNPTRDGGSTSNDAAKVLRNIKGDDVPDVVVLDMRENDGGIMMEAVKLVALFARQGPVVQVRTSTGEQQVLSSEDVPLRWRGPLVVLVDGRSASAAEIAAGALQDYGRALVVGQQTYGKGSAQTLIDLDQWARMPSSVYGQLNVTTMMFFRPSGTSTQLQGVRPDVVIGEGRLSKMNVGERSFDRALPTTQISAQSKIAPAAQGPNPWQAKRIALQQSSNLRWRNQPWHDLWVSTIRPDQKSPRLLSLTKRVAISQQQKQDDTGLRTQLQAQGEEKKDGAGGDAVLREAVFVAKEAFSGVHYSFVFDRTNKMEENSLPPSPSVHPQPMRNK